VDEFLKWHTAWKIIMHLMTGNIISEVDAFMYFARQKKHMPCRELVGTTECMTL